MKPKLGSFYRRPVCPGRVMWTISCLGFWGEEVTDKWILYVSLIFLSCFSTRNSLLCTAEVCCLKMSFLFTAGGYWLKLLMDSYSVFLPNFIVCFSSSYMLLYLQVYKPQFQACGCATTMLYSRVIIAPYPLFLPSAKEARKNKYGQDIKSRSIESLYDTITFIGFIN